MQVLGYDKMSGSRAAFVASSVLTPGRWWCVSQSSLKAGSAPFNLSKYSKLLFNRLPSTVPVEKIPHDLCPVPQPDTTGKAAWHQWDIKGPLPLWRGKTPKKKWMCHTGGEIGSHPQGVQTYKAVQGVSDVLHVRVQSSVWEHCVLLGLLGFPYNLPISAADVRARSSGGDGCGFLIVIY